VDREVGTGEQSMAPHDALPTRVPHLGEVPHTRQGWEVNARTRVDTVYIFR